MPAFDRLLLDPSPEAVAETMAEAVQSANKRCRVGKLAPDPAGYRQFLAGHAGEPEAVGRWVAGADDPRSVPPNVRATLLGLAWWTDPLGRRHVRVAGRRLEEFTEHHTHRFGPLREERPALALIYPERVYLRRRPGGAQELVAFCGCGAVGTPQQLGWVGECCGPCHDHLQERGTPLPQTAGGPLTLHADGAVTGVGISASGRTVCAPVLGGRADVAGAVVFWDRASGEVRQFHDHDFFMGSPTTPFAANGRFVAADGYGDCRVWDAETGEVLYSMGYGARSPFLALAPDRSLVVAPGAVWEPEGDERWQPLPLGGESETTFSLAYGPDGRTLARGLAGEHVVLLEWGTSRQRHLTAAPEAPPDHLLERCVRSLAFSPDGRLLAAGSGQAPSLMGDEAAVNGRVQLFDAATGEYLAELGSHTGSVLALAFSPGGQHLVSAGADHVLRFWDVSARREACALDWHVGTVYGLAFAPDGQTLASASADGTVRLGPWRQLLAQE